MLRYCIELPWAVFASNRRVCVRFYFLLEILLLLIPLWRLHLNRSTAVATFFRCFVFLPCTRARHILKLLGFISLRISLITSFSLRSNCRAIASKGVRSSHAISMILSIWSTLNSFFSIIALTDFDWPRCVWPVFVFLLSLPIYFLRGAIRCLWHVFLQLLNRRWVVDKSFQAHNHKHCTPLA